MSPKIYVTEHTRSLIPFGWQQHEVSTNNNELTFISPPLNPFLRTYSDLSPHGRKDGRRGLWLIDKLGDYEESAE